jgi:hypothetical protein
MMALEIAARQRNAVLVHVPQQRDQRSASGPGRVGVEDAPDLTEVEQLRLLCAFDRAAEVVSRHDGGEVEERPGDRRDRDAALDRALGVCETVRAVDQPATSLRDAAAARHGDLDERAAPRPDARQRRRAAMAQHGALAGTEHDSQHGAFSAQLGVADGVDAMVDPRQPPGRQPVVDRILSKTQAQQLPPRRQPVLLRRQRQDPALDRVRTAHVAG